MWRRYFCRSEADEGIKGSRRRKSERRSGGERADPWRPAQRKHRASIGRKRAADLFQAAEVVEAVEAGAVAVAEIETEGVVADLFPAEDADTGETARTVAAVLVAEDVAFALGFGGRRSGAEMFESEIGFGAVVPDDGDLFADELDIGRAMHGVRTGKFLTRGNGGR